MLRHSPLETVLLCCLLCPAPDDEEEEGDDDVGDDDDAAAVLRTRTCPPPPSSCTSKLSFEYDSNGLPDRLRCLSVDDGLSRRGRSIVLATRRTVRPKTCVQRAIFF